MTNTPMHSTWRSYWNLFSSERFRMVAGVVLSFLQGMSLVPMAWLVRSFFDTALVSGSSDRVLILLGLMALVICVNAVLTLATRSVTLRAVKAVIANLRERLVRHVLWAQRRVHGSRDIDSTHTAIVQDTERIDCMMSALIVQVVPSVLVIIGISTVLALININLFGIVLVVVPFMFFVARLLHAHMHAHIKRFHSIFAQFSSRIQFTLSFYDLITVSAAHHEELARQAQVIAELRHTSGRMAWWVTAYSVLQGGLMHMSGLVVLGWGGIQVMRGETTMGTLIAFFAALSFMLAAARSLISAIPAVLEGRASYEAIAPLLKEETIEVGPVKDFGNNHRVELHDVSFKHGEKVILRRVNAVFEPGAVTGIVGSSGAGKSTLLQLLAGVYSPDEGEICVNNIPLAQIETTAYRRLLGVVLQDAPIFEGTVRENLLYGAPAFTENDIAHIIELCELTPMIARLPEGLETRVGERGILLSGGQRQRIAIARALLRKPRILLLDEPDNNLDKKFVAGLLTTLKMRGVTTITVSHAEHLEPLYDRVYQLTEEGILLPYNS